MPGQLPDAVHRPRDQHRTAGRRSAAGKPLCACKGSGQFDPIIEVVPGTGAVYALYMNGFNIMFTKSTNHGATWSAPVKTYGSVSWNDKPVIAESDNGQDVYLSFNGPTGGDPWVAQSHDARRDVDAGQARRLEPLYFAFDADVAPDGTVYFGESSLLYGGGGNKGTIPTGTIDEHVFISRDHGATWIDKVVAQTQPGLACTAAGCTPDFYLGHDAVTRRRERQPRLPLRRGDRRRRQAVDLCLALDRPGATWSTPAAISLRTRRRRCR